MSLWYPSFGWLLDCLTALFLMCYRRRQGQLVSHCLLTIVSEYALQGVGERISWMPIVLDFWSSEQWVTRVHEATNPLMLRLVLTSRDLGGEGT